MLQIKNIFKTPYLINLKKSISLEHLHEIAFYLFLLTIPFQTRVIIATANSYEGGGFIEYNTLSLYLSDIILIITLILYFVNIFTPPSPFLRLIKLFPHLINSFSYFKKTPTLFIAKNLFNFIPLKLLNVNVSREAFPYQKILNNPLSWLIFFFLWSLLSISWSVFKEISIYQNIKLLEFILLALYVSANIRTFKKNLYLLFFLCINGTLQSLLGITQFIEQHSLGLKVLGESSIGQDIPGVAKLILQGIKIVRSYGTFPHPNIFAGFLILTIFSTLLLIIFLNSKNDFQIASREAIFNAHKINIFLLLSIIIQNIAIVFTFSRSGWLGIIIAYSSILIINKIKKFKIDNLTSISLVKIFLAIYFMLVIIFIPSRFGLNNLITDDSIAARLYYNDIAIQIIKQYPLSGIGLGNFVIRINDFTDYKINEFWLYQPVHQIYYLIGAELGIPGLILFGLFIIALFAKVINKIASRETFYDYKIIKTVYLIILGVFLFISLFDHYFWTLQNGKIMLWLLIGLLLTNDFKHIKYRTN